MSDKNMNLFKDFQPLSTTDWEEKIKKDLKGADYERKLITKSLNGFNIKPYYRAEDIKNIPFTDIEPGQFPYIRGNDAEAKPAEIHTDIKIEDYKKANIEAIEFIEKGITSIGFIFENDSEPTKKNLKSLLKGIAPENIKIGFKPDSKIVKFAQNLFHILENPETAKGSIDYDPVGNMTTIGSCCLNDNCNCFGDLIELIKFCKEKLPEFKTINIHGNNFRNAGSTAVQELAFGMAIGNEYLAALTDQEIEPEDITSQIMFTFGIGSDYFIEIAKLRAARLLWSKVVTAYVPDNHEAAKTYFHSETSIWNKSVYDAYVNMLRTTTESMSALLGGSDSLSVMPFDITYKESDTFSKRIARNTQIILNEEAKFDEVKDPASGAYYIEYLTLMIAENAWELFKQVENKGGFNKAMQEGFIQSEIKKVTEERDRNIAMGKDVILGTNQFPNGEERISEKTKNGFYTKKIQQNPQVEPLKIYRGAQAFEEMRIKTEKAGKTPTVFMLTIGNRVMRTARAGFASNFFESAGFKIINNIGFETVKEGMLAAQKAEADILVLCSSDNEYDKFVPETIELINDKTVPVVAGYPKDNIEKFKSLGMKYFIHVKSDLLGVLKEFQQELGIN